MPTSTDDGLPIVENEEARPPSPASVARRSPQDNELDLQPSGCGSSMCCNPTSGVHRFIALIFMCLLGFGSYFCYDNPGALQEVFKHDLNITTTEFTLIYSIYSWPNVVLCFIGGFLIDRVFGIRLGTIIYLFILLIGQLIFASGGLLGTFWLMIVGLFIFRIGAESLAVAQNNYAVLWFKGKELNMVFGLQLSVARFGSTVNFWVMQPIYDYVSKFYTDHRAIGVVLLLAAGTCVLSLLCALILGWMDKRAERILQRNTNPSGEIAKLSDVTTFKVSFWMVSIICVAYYVAIFPFIALGKTFFMHRFHFTPDQANNVNSIVYLISAIASPVFGFVIDKTGRNVSWVFCATFTTIGAHALLAFTLLNPYIGMIIMGLSYSMLAASLWPLVALIIPEYQLGTAYGFCQSVQNLGLAVITIVAGMIVDRSDGNYVWVELFFMGWLTVALISTCVIWGYDKKVKGNLNMTPAQRVQYASAIRAANQDNGVYSSDQEPLLDD
uniref:Lysosomal dipeptide transporter MFSD1 n=1 Tax=Bactrocera latifrons TaxID=174628 RepID=A0A0K8WHX6_BACLA